MQDVRQVISPGFNNGGLFTSLWNNIHTHHLLIGRLVESFLSFSTRVHHTGEEMYTVDSVKYAHPVYVKTMQQLIKRMFYTFQCHLLMIR